MKQITKIRKAVCTMANELKRAGYTLSDAFRKAWKQIKLSAFLWKHSKSSLTIKAAGVTFENRQERLEFLRKFRPDDLSVTLEREPSSKYDSNAIRIVVHILPLSRRTVIGYVPRRIARDLKDILDMGIQVKAALVKIIGGYSYKESLGALIDIAV